jgi:hypothetical protein
MDGKLIENTLGLDESPVYELRGEALVSADRTAPAGGSPVSAMPPDSGDRRDCPADSRRGGSCACADCTCYLCHNTVKHCAIHQVGQFLACEDCLADLAVAIDRVFERNSTAVQAAFKRAAA